MISGGLRRRVLPVPAFLEVRCGYHCGVLVDAADIRRNDDESGTMTRVQENRLAHDLTVPWALPDGPSGVTSARRATREQLRALGVDDGATVDVVELIVSELTANVVKHVRGPSTLRVQRIGATIRVEVCDPDPQNVPEEHHPDTEAIGGRGLLLVAAMATSWGYDRSERYKCTWAGVDMSLSR